MIINNINKIIEEYLSEIVRIKSAKVKNKKNTTGNNDII